MNRFTTELNPNPAKQFLGLTNEFVYLNKPVIKSVNLLYFLSGEYMVYKKDKMNFQMTRTLKGRERLSQT